MTPGREHQDLIIITGHRIPGQDLPGRVIAISEAGLPAAIPVQAGPAAAPPADPLHTVQDPAGRAVGIPLLQGVAADLQEAVQVQAGAGVNMNSY